MKLIEVTGNLFDTQTYTKENVVFAHCIASDFGMYGGIATQFIDRFNMKEKLIEWSKYNSVVLDTHKRRGAFVNFQTITRPSLVGKAVKIDNVYNLVTKELTGELPTIQSLERALADLKVQMNLHNERYLAIPDMIGCGIDNLDRTQVVNTIRSIFLLSDIIIYAVKLKTTL